MEEDDYIVVSCLNTMALPDLHGAILKAAGYRIEETQTKTVGGRWTYGAQFVGEGKVPLLARAEGTGSVNRETGEETQTQSTRLEIDLADVNDIILALQEIAFSKYIVLEDFHYLPVDTQRNFAFALKAFHENASLCFIVVGVWREQNRLIYYNGDLTNRVISVDVDLWSPEELRMVIESGEKLLNIQFADSIKNGVIENCSDSVSLVQEACYRVCEQTGISETQSETKAVGDGIDARVLIRQIVNDQAGRYSAFITNFSEGFQQTDLQMYKWLVYAVITSSIEELESGLRRSQISYLIKSKHPLGEQLNEGNVTQALQNAASLQILKGIRPIVIDYDQTTRVLSIVDRSFLIWLAQQDRGELLRELEIEE